MLACGREPPPFDPSAGSTTDFGEGLDEPFDEVLDETLVEAVVEALSEALSEALDADLDAVLDADLDAAFTSDPALAFTEALRAGEVEPAECLPVPNWDAGRAERREEVSFAIERSV